MSTDGSGEAGTALLRRTIESLRREVAGLREAEETRAVVERAKGILMERLSITGEEAAERLQQLADRAGQGIAAAAAAVLGTALPGAAYADSAGLAPGGDLTALLEHFEGSRMRRGEAAAELVRDALLTESVDAVVLYRAHPDGSARLVGQVGFPADTVSAYRSLPPSTDLPLTNALLTGQSEFFPDVPARQARFPTLERGTRFEATAVVPIADAGRIVGVVGLAWRAAQRFEPPRVSWINGVVDRLGAALLRASNSDDPELQWAAAVLGAVLDPWLVVEPVKGTTGDVEDFVVSDCSPLIAGGAALLGRRMLTVWPDTKLDSTFATMAGLSRVGGLWTGGVERPSSAPWGIPGTRLRGVRVGRRLVLLWRPPEVDQPRG